ncbi:hypothetical protein SAMN05444858_11876 [Micromonospora avicenniae]|uniref:Flavin reductase n=1 Tax=Micromonospora avicenniae TaxID=1198245 RepID=A0A1N7DTZ5_9ACTN|nr:hypothetical protein SAMN05444858_11876 [Micromonospora avicenniae]
MNGGARPHPALPDDHLPVTPDWICSTCGTDWPCSTKRSRLLEEYGRDRAALGVYLAACLAAASAELRRVPVDVLQQRFTGWLPRPRRPF